MKIKFFFQDELKKLLDTIKQENFKDYVIFYFAYRKGLRASEIGKITMDKLDLENNRVYIESLKKSMSCFMPLNQDEKVLLKEYIEKYQPVKYLFYGKTKEKPISRKTLDKKIKKYGKKAELPKDKLHFHTLRHSLAIHLLQAGIDVRIVQKIMRHKDIKNTMIYTEITDSMRDEAYMKALQTGQVL
jgi:site-specific recombinase XerD